MNNFFIVTINFNALKIETLIYLKHIIDKKIFSDLPLEFHSPVSYSTAMSVVREHKVMKTLAVLIFYIKFVLLKKEDLVTQGFDMSCIYTVHDNYNH